jgi:hypothetical protein
MNNPAALARKCLLCGHDCQVLLERLGDDRFGAPGAYDIIRCSRCGLEQTWPRPGWSNVCAAADSRL